jgi:hypothetical protein
MKNREEAQFAQWKKAHLMEGFLDGEEQKPASSEEVAAEEETKTEDTPAETDAPDNTDEAPAEDSNEENTDISDEGNEPEKDDGLDDDFEGEKSEETGTTSSDPEVAELKDAIATLTTQIQALTDQMMKANGEDTGEKTEGEETSTEETTEEVPEEGGEEGGEEKPSEEKTEEAPAESEETTEEAPADETKSEAYNFYCRKGKILSENSGYMISVLNEGRYDKLEDSIMTLVKAKIRQRINAAKTKLRTEAFNKKFGE